MTNVWNVVDGLKPTMLMVVVQIAFAGVNVLYKLAVNDGMNLRIVVAYRFIFATAFIVPLALILERNKRPKMTWTVLFQAFLSGLLGGALAQNLYLEALALTSATFASAMANLIPAITFIMAVSFRMERLNLRTAAGKVKIIGTLTGISGAMVLTFFKGTQIDTGSFHVTLLRHHPNGHVASPHSPSGDNTLLGALCALASCFCYALWLIIQTKMGETYPCYYSSTALMSIMGSVSSVVFALCLERDWSQWKLGWNVRLLTTAYSGIVASGVMVVVIAWCVHLRGPLFASVFNPLMLLIVALAGSVMLDEKLHLGSVIGGVLIVCGLYLVLWGKGKEMKKMNQLVPSQSLHDHVSGTVEIIIGSPAAEDKSNHHNNNYNAAEVIRDHEDSSENGISEVGHQGQSKGKKEEVISRNVSNA